MGAMAGVGNFLASAGRWVLGGVAGGYLMNKVSGGGVQGGLNDIAEAGIETQSIAQWQNGNIDNFAAGRNRWAGIAGWFSGLFAMLANVTGSQTLKNWANQMTTFRADEQAVAQEEGRKMTHSSISNPNPGSPDAAIDSSLTSGGGMIPTALGIGGGIATVAVGTSILKARGEAKEEAKAARAESRAEAAKIRDENRAEEREIRREERAARRAANGGGNGPDGGTPPSSGDGPDAPRGNTPKSGGGGMAAAAADAVEETAEAVAKKPGLMSRILGSVTGKYGRLFAAATTVVAVAPSILSAEEAAAEAPAASGNTPTIREVEAGMKNEGYFNAAIKGLNHGANAAVSTIAGTPHWLGEKMGIDMPEAINGKNISTYFNELTDRVAPAAIVKNALDGYEKGGASGAFKNVVSPAETVRTAAEEKVYEASKIAGNVAAGLVMSGGVGSFAGAALGGGRVAATAAPIAADVAVPTVVMGHNMH